MRVRQFVHARIHRLVFVWLSITIFATGAIVGTMFYFARGEDSWQKNLVRLRDFVAERFVRVWDNPAERSELRQSFGRALQAEVLLKHANGERFEGAIERCLKVDYSLALSRAGQPLGYVEVCARVAAHSHARTGLMTAAAIFVFLWLASLGLARRMVRPLSDLIRVTREIGSGKLSSRVRIGRRYRGEIGVLAEAVNDMGSRIERQINDQRELLAAVSHEIRSPLARLRILAELLRGDGTANPNLEKLEQEVLEIDVLVGKLLASSRLDFDALELKQVNAAAASARALERAGEPLSKLQDESLAAEVRADPTLLARALGNLLENAQKHGQGLSTLSVRREPAHVCFEVFDQGAGFGDVALKRAFDPFYRGHGSGSLGLGLALVARIAKAHSGSVQAQNSKTGGACVSLRLPLAEERTKAERG